jgi:hypothetical protein
MICIRPASHYAWQCASRDALNLGVGACQTECDGCCAYEEFTCVMSQQPASSQQQPAAASSSQQQPAVGSQPAASSSQQQLPAAARSQQPASSREHQLPPLSFLASDPARAFIAKAPKGSEI